LVARLTVRGEPKSGKKKFMREIRSRHPAFWEAVVADARVTARFRGERADFTSRLDTLLQVGRLMLETDAFLAQVAYRAKASLQALGVPLLPRLAHWVAMTSAQVSIGDPVIVQAGVYIVHGQVVVDGIVEIQTGAVLFPFVTVGLIGPELTGPTIGRNARIGTGAKVLGKVRVGADARVGANAVVLEDVPDGATVVGVPARVAGG
jgi:serine O-acetyltransferase